MSDPILPLRWAIFCRVVDNLGDIGVCWRLASDLAAHHQVDVTLWVDDWEALRSLCPQVPGQGPFTLKNVRLQHWPACFPPVAPEAVADVVVEAFACELPEAYLTAMAAVARPAATTLPPPRRPPLWINLEYLSAEAWVDGCHGLASPHPRLPLKKFFFFPGFSSASGGLLREPRVLADCAAFRQDARARADFLAALGVTAPVAGEWLVSLFAYEQPGLPALMAAWAGGAQPVRLLVPAGRIGADVARFCGTGWAAAPFRQGALTVEALPFLAQPDYDRLLWCCDLNFVRGEESFVRAHWAGAPFVWQLYEQAQAAHLAKLEAFLERFCVDLPAPAAEAARRFWWAWNGVATGGTAADCWPAFAAQLPTLAEQSRLWTKKLTEHDDLATNLANFCRSGLK